MKINGTRHEIIFLKQIAIPNINKNMPTYIGFLVLEKTPSVTNFVDCTKSSVVSYFLKSSHAFPISIKPENETIIPARLKGYGIKLNSGIRKYINIIIQTLIRTNTGGINIFLIIVITT